MNDYGTEVKLLALTCLTPSSPFDYDDCEKLIEQASRLCVDKVADAGSRPNYIRDRLAQGHESIIEHASATFYIKASRVLTHELVRHRLASYSQRSQRYVKETEPQYITPPELYGIQIPGIELKKCASSSGFPRFFESFVSYVDVAKTSMRTYRATLIFDSFMKLAWVVYSLLLRCGATPEIARYILPNACETQIIMTMNFRELRHFIKLRTSARALPEMREVAGKVRDICKSIAPQVFGDI